MPITDYTNLSKSNAIFLFEFDIIKENLQWVNAGAGIWSLSMGGTYSWVDSTLLDGFSAQAFYPVGSIKVDASFYTRVSTLLLVTSINESWYYNPETNYIYVHFVNNDEPFLHDTYIGIINGYSTTEFTPMNSGTIYQGRIIRFPTIGRTRDPLFFGKLSYPEGTIELANGDGYFDTFGEDNNIYGNPARLKFGYKDLDYFEFVQIFTGFIETSTVSEETATFDIADTRKQLSKNVLYNCTEKNALDAIVEILNEKYGYVYSSFYYDTTVWDAATLLAPNITIAMEEDEEEPVINIIEKICVSVFGFFDVTEDGLFTFKYVNPTDSASTTIVKADQLNRIEVTYDPSEVVSSVKIGYAYDGSEYSYVTDTSREAAIYEKYKTYNKKTFETYLTTSTAASALASSILDYVEDVHGTIPLQVPLRYYSTQVGDVVDAVLNRSVLTMLGTKECEVLRKEYNLESTNIEVTLRIN